MREYLLGTADPSAADAFEDRYFTDRNAFLRLNQCERDLITDYLEGRLSTADRSRFESRYLTVPVLRDRLDEMRRKRGVSLTRRPPNKLFWQCAVAALLLVTLFGGIRLFKLPSRTVSESRKAASISEAPPAPLFVVVLKPGLSKGNSAGANITLSESGGTIRFMLDTQGFHRNRDVFADLSIVESDGTDSFVWKSSSALTIGSSSGLPHFILDLNREILHSGDYMISLHTPDGAVLDRFLFRISAQ